MHNTATLITLTLAGSLLLACSKAPEPTSTAQDEQQPAVAAPATDGKVVVYQVFTRLFGNQNTTNQPWGTLEQNGVGKFADFTPQALEAIKAMGVSHVREEDVLRLQTGNLPEQSEVVILRPSTTEA